MVKENNAHEMRTISIKGVHKTDVGWMRGNVREERTNNGQKRFNESLTTER